MESKHQKIKTKKNQLHQIQQSSLREIVWKQGATVTRNKFHTKNSWKPNQQPKERTYEAAGFRLFLDGTPTSFNLHQWIPFLVAKDVITQLVFNLNNLRAK